MLYTVQKGDTLRAIAARLTLDPSYYIAIARHNGITDPNVIKAGIKLEIPDNWLKTVKQPPLTYTTKPVTITAPAVIDPATGYTTNAGQEMVFVPQSDSGINWGKWALFGGLGIIAFVLLTRKK